MRRAIFAIASLLALVSSAGVGAGELTFPGPPYYQPPRIVGYGNAYNHFTSATVQEQLDEIVRINRGWGATCGGGCSIYSVVWQPPSPWNNGQWGVTLWSPTWNRTFGGGPVVIYYEAGAAYYSEEPEGAYPSRPTEFKHKPNSCPIGVPPPTCGNPIESDTGHKVQTDVDIPALGLLGFTRYYNSFTAGPTHLLGTLWTNTYTRNVEDLTSKAIVTRPGGKQYVFTLSNGQWVPDADVVASLTRLEDGQGQLLGWTYRSQDDREGESYDALGRLTQVARADGQSVTLTYNYGFIESGPADYLLTSVTGQDGRSLVFDYDDSQRLSTLTDAAGAVYTYQYDAAGRLTAVLYPGAAGSSKMYLYNEPAHMGASVPTALTGIIDEKGARYATFKYDALGRAVSTEHGAGQNKFSVSYNATGGATVSTPSGGSQQRNFGVKFGLKVLTGTVESSPEGVRSPTFSFDSNGHTDLVTDASRTSTDYDVNARGLVTQSIESANKPATKRTTQTDWDPVFRAPTERRVLNAAGAIEAKSTWTYNARGQELTATVWDVTVTPNAARTTTTSYCEAADVAAGRCPRVGLATSVDGPRSDVNDVTSYTYYANDDATCATSPTTCPHRKGDLWKVTNPLGQTTQILAYDGAGRRLATADANGVVTEFEYAPRGWLTFSRVRGSDDSIEADDAITQLEYDAIGQVSKVIQPDGAFTIFSYDDAHRLFEVTDALGNKTKYTLNNAGNRIAEETKDPSGSIKRSLSRVYDTLGQLKTSADAFATPTDYTYDLSGAIDKVTDPLLRVTDNDVDPLGRLIKTVANLGGGATDKATTQFQYDARDNLTAVVDPKGLATSYVYNGFGDLKQLVSPDTGTTSYNYDLGGNRLGQLDPRGVATSYGYDALGRLRSQTVPTAAQNVFFDFDISQSDCVAGETFGVGRLSRIRDESGSTRFCYDRRGNLVRKVQTVAAGSTLTVGASYSAADRLSSMTYPSGAIVVYGRNDDGQIDAIAAVPKPGATQVVLVESATYLPFGPVNVVTFGNSSRRALTKSYDANYGIDKVFDSAASNPLSEDFSLNEMGNVVSLSERVSTTASVDRGLTYDGLDRMTGQKNGNTTVEAFTYDPTGNRLSKSAGSSSSNYTYAAQSHRLSSVGTVARVYDANGNTTAIDTSNKGKVFTFDDRNRLRDIKVAGKLKGSYRYNAKGERVLRIDSTTSTNSRQYVYDEAGHLLGEYTTSGARVQEYVWMDDTLVAILSDHDGTTYQYVETDHLGTPRAVIHPTKNTIVWRWDVNVTSFGEHSPNADPDANRVNYTLHLRFPGQLYDPISGLHYNYFRDYDPTTGRYIESDPIGLAGGMSTYAYVGGSPLTAYDRYGLCWSNQRASAHYFAGGGRTVSLSEIGCTSTVGSKVQPQRNIWIAKAKAAAREAAYAMQCDTFRRLTMGRSVGVSSGIFWIGGFSLHQESNCLVKKNCGSTAGLQCKRDSYSFECVLGSRMHDLFVNPSDFDNSANTPNADFWDEYSYGGSPFHVDGYWSDSISGGGQL